MVATSRPMQKPRLYGPHYALPKHAYAQMARYPVPTLTKPAVLAVPARLGVGVLPVRVPDRMPASVKFIL